MSSTIPVPGKCNTPCKYHKKGACKMGAACRFLHVNPKKRPASPETHQLAVNKTVCNQICKFGRRPFLHMVVLYASDPRVTVFAQEVLEKFLKHGIDVAVQRHLIEQNKFSSSPSALKKKDVRTEHLAEIICSSHADFLIVLGDRNMKNKSCQAKRKGKLMEMKVLEMISLIWKSWPQNPQKTLTRIQNLTQPQTETLLLQYCGLRHAFSRVQYLEAVINDLKKSASESASAEEQNLKLENVQKCCVRLHKQLKKCFICVGEVPVQTDTQSTRGCVMTLDYKPNSSRSPRNSISLILQKFLQKVLYNLLKSTEECVATLLQGWQIPMWDEYIKQHMETFSVDVGSLEIAFEAPPPQQVETLSDDEDSDYESELSDESDLANLADLEIEDDQSESGFGTQTEDDESDSEQRKGLSRSSVTKARSVSSPSRMSAATRANTWYGNIPNVWGPDDDSEDSIVARGISEPVLPTMPTLDFDRYPSSASLDDDSERASWLATEAVWYNHGREEILSRESPRDYSYAESSRKPPPGFSAMPMRSTSFDEAMVGDTSLPPYLSSTKRRSKSVVTTTVREPMEQANCQFFYPGAPLSSGRALSPPTPSASGRSHANPMYSHSMAPSWNHPSANWPNPSPSPFSSQYAQMPPSHGNVPPLAGVGSSMKDASGLPSSGKTKPVRSSTGPSSTTSPYRGFNATIGAHLQEQQQTKTISLFDNPSPLAPPYSPREAAQAIESSPSIPAQDSAAAPASYPVLSPNTAPFVPGLRTSTANSVNLGMGTQYGLGTVGSGLGSPRHSSSPTAEVGGQFSATVGGFTDKRSPLVSSAKSPRSSNNGHPTPSSPRSKISSSDSATALPDFETISQIWGDDHALFEVAWPWSPTVQSNTEVTVRSGDRGQKTFSASF